MALDIVIKSEEDAWHWLERVLDDDPELDQPVDLRFEGWPVLDFKFSGRDFDSSVPTRIMPPLLEAQKEVQRIYCQLRYGASNLRKLTKEDRERLELVVRVDQGSSKFLANLEDALTEAFKSAVNRLESKDIMKALIAGALIWGSNVGWKNWLNYRAEAVNVESRVQMSELELRKLEMLNRVIEEEPDVDAFAEGADEFRNDSLRTLRPVDELTLPDDVTVDGELASEITTTPREQSVEARIDGEFVILSVDSGGTRGFRIRVRNEADGRVIIVSIPEGTLTGEQRRILMNNEWAKRPVLMQINARILRDEIRSATLVSVENIAG